MNKYGAIKTQFNGQTYDSKKEALFAQELEFRKKAKNKSERVLKYETQVPYEIVINGQKICKYLADFVVHYSNGKHEVIDVKSSFTRKLPVYRLKRKLMKACLGIEIIEVE